MKKQKNLEELALPKISVEELRSKVKRIFKDFNNAILLFDFVKSRDLITQKEDFLCEMYSTYPKAVYALRNQTRFMAMYHDFYNELIDLCLDDDALMNNFEDGLFLDKYVALLFFIHLRKIHLYLNRFVCLDMPNLSEKELAECLVQYEIASLYLENVSFPKGNDFRLFTNKKVLDNKLYSIFSQIPNFQNLHKQYILSEKDRMSVQSFISKLNTFKSCYKKNDFKRNQNYYNMCLATFERMYDRNLDTIYMKYLKLELDKIKVLLDSTAESGISAERKNKCF